MLKQNYRLIVDTRERKPLLKPGTTLYLPMLKSMFVGDTMTVTVDIVKEAMSEADYCLLGYESVMLVERKGGIRELAKNCLTNDRDRFRRVLERMRDKSQYPVLLVEGSYAALW